MSHLFIYLCTSTEYLLVHLPTIWSKRENRSQWYVSVESNVSVVNKLINIYIYIYIFDARARLEIESRRREDHELSRIGEEVQNDRQ